MGQVWGALKRPKPQLLGGAVLFDAETCLLLSFGQLLSRSPSSTQESLPLHPLPSVVAGLQLGKATVICSRTGEAAAGQSFPAGQLMLSK